MLIKFNLLLPITVTGAGPLRLSGYLQPGGSFVRESRAEVNLPEIRRWRHLPLCEVQLTKHFSQDWRWLPAL